MSEKVHTNAEGENYLQIESRKSARIKTLEQLLEVGQANLKDWEVTNFLLNKWEVGAKDPDGFIVVEPLFQVKAWLRRRKLRSLFPVIRPLQMNRKSRTYREPAQARREGIETVLILPDPHFGFRRDRNGKLVPFHDMRALDVVLQIAYELRPHKIIHLGDILDLPDFSDVFLTSPDMQQLTQPAVIAANWWINLMQQASPGATHFLLGGNHDQRIEKAILKHLKAAYDLRPVDELDLPPSLSIPRLLALHELGVIYEGPYPNGEHFLADDLLAIHGNIARKGGGKTTSIVVKEHDISIIQGHTHRLERSSRTLFRGSGTKTIAAYSLGCLCHIDGRVPAKFKRNDWQQGFGIAYIKEGIDSSVNLYEIKNGRAMFGQKVFEGEDRTAVLREDTGWPMF